MLVYTVQSQHNQIRFAKMLAKGYPFRQNVEVWIFATGEIVIVPEICPGVNVRGGVNAHSPETRA